jgi:hypothetical protein
VNEKRDIIFISYAYSDKHVAKKIADCMTSKMGIKQVEMFIPDPLCEKCNGLGAFAWVTKYHVGLVKSIPEYIEIRS